MPRSDFWAANADERTMWGCPPPLETQSDPEFEFKFTASKVHRLDGHCGFRTGQFLHYKKGSELADIDWPCLHTTRYRSRLKFHGHFHMLWTAVSAAGALFFRLALTSYFSLVLHPAQCIRPTPCECRRLRRHALF